MPMLNCYVDDATLATLKEAAEARGRNETPELLAEAAISDAASTARRAKMGQLGCDNGNAP